MVAGISALPANFPLGAAQYASVVNGDTLATAATGTLSFTSPATAASNVGSYAITGSGLTANNGNYVFVQAAGNATALALVCVLSLRPWGRRMVPPTALAEGWVVEPL